jgi:hypothetical protein
MPISHLGTRPYAPAAKNTAIGIPDDYLTGIIRDAQFFVYRETDIFDAELIGKILQFTPATNFTGKTIVFVFRQNHLKVDTAQLIDFFIFGYDLHPVRYQCRTRRHQTSHALHFDKAESADPGGAQTLLMAKVGDLEAVILASGQQKRIFLYRAWFAVD